MCLRARRDERERESERASERARGRADPIDAHRQSESPSFFIAAVSLPPPAAPESRAERARAGVTFPNFNI